MRTTKPIATISFNTPEYLKLKLDELTKAKKIAFWAYIVHQPEDDEAGNKVHMHVYIEPSAMVQTEDLRDEFKEYDPQMPDKPKGCLTFLSSKFGPWYLYGLHDKRYLASKGQARRYHYKHEEMVSSDGDDLLCKARSIDMLSLSPYADMEEAIENGFLWEEYLKRGNIPIPQIRPFKFAWDCLVMEHTNRNLNKDHPSEYEEDRP